MNPVKAAGAAGQEAGNSNLFSAIGNLSIISIIYGALLLFFVYKIIKGKSMEKKLEGPIYSVKRGNKKSTFLICLLMAVMGVISFVGGQKLDGVVMILLAIVFYFYNLIEIKLGQNGMLADNNFIEWKEIRKWGWDTKRGDLVYMTKERGKAPTSSSIHIGQENMEEVNKQIRRLKLGKE